jgi:hypothetical protein
LFNFILNGATLEATSWKFRNLVIFSKWNQETKST